MLIIHSLPHVQFYLFLYAYSIYISQMLSLCVIDLASDAHHTFTSSWSADTAQEMRNGGTTPCANTSKYLTRHCTKYCTRLCTQYWLQKIIAQNIQTSDFRLCKHLIVSQMYKVLQLWYLFAIHLLHFPQHFVSSHWFCGSLILIF